jgi:hypothetical protein
MKDNHVQHHGAHSGSRGGISDYNDGCNIWHYGGNDETDNLDNRPAFISGDEKNEEYGKIASGNELKGDEEFEHDGWELLEFRFQQIERPLHSGL